MNVIAAYLVGAGEHHVHISLTGEFRVIERFETPPRASRCVLTVSIRASGAFAWVMPPILYSFRQQNSAENRISITPVPRHRRHRRCSARSPSMWRSRPRYCRRPARCQSLCRNTLFIIPAEAPATGTVMVQPPFAGYRGRR